MKRSYFIGLLLVPFLLQPAEAQLPFSFDHPIIIDDKAGLPSKDVEALVQDQNGFVWMGTYREGLARFDGYHLEVFQYQRNDPNSLPSNQIEEMLVDHNNRLWVGTAGGLCYFQPETHNFFRLSRPEKPGSAYFQERILALYQDEEEALWIGTQERLMRFDMEADSLIDFRFSAPEQDSLIDIARIRSIKAIAPDPLYKEVLWLGSLSGLIRFDKTTQQYDWYPNIMDNKNRQYLANSIKLLHVLPNGKVLVGSWAGAYLFDPEKAVYQEIRAPEEANSSLSESSITSFFKMPEYDQIGITHNGGFCLYDPETQQVTSNFNNNYQDSRIYSAHFIDQQKRVWGKSEHGVYLYNPLVNRIRRIRFPFRNKLYPILPRAIVESRQAPQLFIAALAMNGIITWHQEQNRWSIIPPPPGFSWNSGIQDMIRLENGRIIVLGNNELFELLEDQKKIVPLFPQLNFGSPAFRKVVEGAPNELWIGSRRAGLFRLDLDSGKLQIYTKELDKNPNDTRHRWIETLYKDSRGQIWIRTAFEYSVYLPRKDTFFHWDSYGRDSSENFSLVAAFQEDQQGRMWMAGEHLGLAMASVKEVEQGVKKIVTGTGGLPVLNVANLGMDHQGYLWLEHPNGITRYHPETEESRYFSPGYGVPPTGLELITSLSDGQMLLGIPDGFALFLPEDLTPNRELPVPYLSSFKVFDQEVSDLESAESLQEINLSYRQNFFSFEFSALAFNLPEQVRFRYRLVGFDPQWNQAGQRRYASYTNIPGGDYVFELEAANNEGTWNKNSLAIPIHITTPWWKAAWFLVPLGVLALIGITFSLRWRIRQVRKQEQIKSEFTKKLAGMELHALRAQMNPHFIFNCLNSIDYYIIKNETEKASDYLNRFSRLIRLILQNSRAEYVNLKDELEALKLYMEMESLRFDDSFEYVVRVSADMQLESLEIPPLLLQPYVENAIWHGLAPRSNGRNRLDLTITRQNGLLHCRIEDNGIGREAARKLKGETTSKHRSMGMYITRDRLQLINRMHHVNAEVKITDLKGNQGEASGTRVDIIVPIR